jgi:hypothetical protein
MFLDSKARNSAVDAQVFTCVNYVGVNLQGTDVVVVVGMLHCNGVARWLLSGLDPPLR